MASLLLTAVLSAHAALPPSYDAELGILGGWVPRPTWREVPMEPCLPPFPRGPLGLLGGRIGYRLSPALGLEAHAGWTPAVRLVQGDPVCTSDRIGPADPIETINNHRTRPTSHLGAAVVFTPLYGTIAFGRAAPMPLGVTLRAGSGAVHTNDYARDVGAEVLYPDDQRQWHPSLEVGGGLGIQVSRHILLRLDLDAYHWLEVSNHTTLDVHRMARVSMGASWLLAVNQPSDDCGTPQATLKSR